MNEKGRSADIPVPANARRFNRRRIILLVASAVVILLAVCGCQTVSSYRQAIGGELQILTHQEPIAKVLADPGTSSELKHKLQLVLEIRQFAATNLHLPVDQAYMKYVDLHRPYAVWNVNAAPKLSLDPKRWWYPFVGKASYRGYFNREAARKYANELKNKGWDTYVGAVETYSTLGWFRDPVLNTFINEPDADLGEILFHELGHKRVFISGDTDFNEAFATTVGEEGVRRWLKDKPDLYSTYEREREHEAQFVQLVLQSRDELEAVYDSTNILESVKLERKAQIIAEMRAKYQKLKAQWGTNEYEHWFTSEINNAKLNTIAAYYTLVPAFHALLQANGGDMEKFYIAVERLGKLSKDKRHDALEQSLHTVK
jgi:predicted aminopeptidase